MSTGSNWNRPVTGAKTETAKKPVAARGVLAGLIVVIIGGAVAWLVLSFGSNEPKEKAVRDRGLIKEVKPNVPKVKPAEEKQIDPNYRPTKPFEKANGYVMLPSGRLHKMSANVLTNDMTKLYPKPKYAIFPHHVENQISALLTLSPGETLVGTPHYGELFVKEFLKSLSTPIIVSKDDDEETASLKRAMIETKKDLKARYDAGENIADIMNATHEEYQKLSRTKQMVRDELFKLQRNPDATMQDVDDFLTAANKILEQKGIAPMELSPVTRQMLMLHKGGQAPVRNETSQER